MRVRIVFQVLNEGGFVPFHQQVLLSSFVHDFLPSQLTSGHSWNFSGLKGQTRVTARGLYYNSQRVTLVFSSPNRELVISFISAVFSSGGFGLAGLELQPIQVIEEGVESFEISEKYICISPMVILAEGFPEQELKQFLSPNADAFADLLFESTMSRMERAGITLTEQEKLIPFQFRPDEEYLQVSRNKDRKFSRIYSLEGFGNFNELRAYTLPFFLDAAPAVHNFIFNSGIGEATRYGFGMIDFAERKNRTQLTEFSFSADLFAGRA